MHTILYGVTSQTLDHVPPERVTAATYAIEDLDYDADDTANRVLASGAATVDDLSLTTDAAAGATEVDARKIPVSATTGAAIGDPIVIVHSDGWPWEHARVAAVVAGDYLLVEHPLMGTYDSGSAVYGTRLTCSFPDNAAADEDYIIADTRLRVVWGYTIDGTPRRSQEAIIVRRQRGGTEYDAMVAQRFRDAYPDLSEKMPTAATLERWVAYCAEDVRARLLARGIDPSQMMMGEQGAQALLARVVLHAADNGLAPGIMPVETFQDRAQQQFELHFGSIVTGQPGHGVTETERSGGTAMRKSDYRSPLGGM
jgi:hypothetical protein